MCFVCGGEPSGVCRAAFLRISPSSCFILGLIENYKYITTSIAATSKVWVGWDATSKKSDWWQAVRNIISAHPGGWRVACPSTSVTLHERNDNFLISVSFLTSTLNKSHCKINACHVKGDTRTGNVSWCYTTLQTSNGGLWELSAASVHYGPFLYTMRKTIRTCCRRLARQLALHCYCWLASTVPAVWCYFIRVQWRSSCRRYAPLTSAANVSSQVMKQRSVFISVR